ncbi:hypothetical protein B0T20DRAFT_150116 [Sordaria brevicollis]|uniref:Uncharacterized protein n=1 Tax=Sordaria brevicollis TaxID=83679 RepID=A0AAE0UDZ3_SORBR|nr:hypothetical protein B0T20DRAFT_150116 [Sordaria brevicollis]
MSRTSRTLTNTDLAFLLCALAAASQSPKTSLSFETDYGLVLSLEPDGSIIINLRKPSAPVPQIQYNTDLNPFDNSTPIKSQQRFAFPSSGPGPDYGHGSIDGVLFSPLPLGSIGSGGASITPARTTPQTPLTRTSSQKQSERGVTTKPNSNSNSSPPAAMKIKYYIRPGLEANSSSHMYYTASSPPVSPQPQSQPQPRTGTASKEQHPKLRLHRVKLSHLQTLYHLSSSPSSKSNSWFDSYLDWIDRLEDALSYRRQQRGEPRTPITAIPVFPIAKGERDPGPFADSGERSLWLVEGMLLACWLSLQEGVEGVEYCPLAEGGMSERHGGVGVYRLEQRTGDDGGGKGVSNGGTMMGRLLEVIRAGE